MQCITFDDLVSSPDKKFLKLFTPSFTSVEDQEDPTIQDIQDRQESNSTSSPKRPKMSRIPTSGSRGPAVSRLAPPGSLSKRPREGSMDLEAGMDAKKSKIDSVSAPVTNLAKSKSKSMMSIAGASGKSLYINNQKV